MTMKKYILAVFSLLFISHQSYAEPAVTDSFTFKGHKITLTQNQQKCQLEVSSSDQKKLHPLALTAPCYFLRNGDSDPQSYRYPDVNVEAAFIVLGNPVSADEREIWNLSSDIQCGTQGQGLLFDGVRFSVSQKTLNRILICKDKGSDEKNYRFLCN
ncbi:hypothetical protein [Brenneria corticis]|uniref:Ricin B lectin domain-containing protein n=1 Tax=Brenneria corticis TaxID=2173106 RepID=A0A2U1TL42_9GAMM|nr:hypothetical protein [Brenneria sp. CFCC 11842]PWC10121.1 hypothetical protein DDT56_22505 [Brenneria sp. CFCC 11842]